MPALFLLVCLSLPFTLSAQAVSETARMPVRELTAFKDGHAFVLRDAPLCCSACTASACP